MRINHISAIFSGDDYLISPKISRDLKHHGMFLEIDDWGRSQSYNDLVVRRGLASLRKY